jgi:hypothetical protein
MSFSQVSCFVCNLVTIKTWGRRSDKTRGKNTCIHFTEFLQSLIVSFHVSVFHFSQMSVFPTMQVFLIHGIEEAKSCQQITW